MKQWLTLALSLLVCFSCNEPAEDLSADIGAGDGDPGAGYSWLDGDTSDCEFPELTFKLPDGTLTTVSINGLPVSGVMGADKSGVDTVAVVSRRGVRFSAIFTAAELEVQDDTPVNCIARDGFDPLRTKLKGDPTLLPTYAFLRDHGYVYLGNPGDKDPLFPEMEGRSLAVDYDLSEDSEVPTNLGGNLPALNMFRWKMVEKVSDEQKGIIELGPVQ